MLSPTLLLLVAFAGPVQDREEPGPDPKLVEATVDDLTAALKKGTKEEKVQALARAGDVVAPEVIKAIMRGLRDKEPDVQAAGIQALRWMDHRDAVTALHKTAVSNRAILADEELHAAVIRAIGQHADPSTIRFLAHKPFASPHYRAARARVLALGRIRDEEAVEALIGMMRSSSTRDVDRHMANFRLSLMVLTGTDQGPAAKQWLSWWNANKKRFVVSPTRGELPRPVLMQWTEYWGLEDDYGRTRRREDRGND